jgi:molecular chaperone GrpE
MTNDTTRPGDGTSEVEAIDLDEQTGDLEAAIRDAVAAVEEVQTGARGDGDEGASDDAEVADANDEVNSLRREIADLRDRSMRTLADFDNFRKRSERERQEAKRYALLEPLREFLGVMDNLDLALSAGGSADDLKRGVEMIHRQMQELLRRHGVRTVAAAGSAFDPALHEAVSRLEDPAVQAPTVVEELRRGYTLHDRLLRPAMVKVAVPAEAPKAAGDGE